MRQYEEHPGELIGYGFTSHLTLFVTAPAVIGDLNLTPTRKRVISRAAGGRVRFGRCWRRATKNSAIVPAVATF